MNFMNFTSKAKADGANKAGKIVSRTIQDIKSLKIQGARNIAISALKALKAFSEKNGFGPEFERAAKRLENSRKTAVPLYNAIESALKERNEGSINRLIAFFESAGALSAKNGAHLIKNGMSILTHCHSSEAAALFLQAKSEGKKFRVIVTETRPKLQGLKTAQELLKAKIPVEYIVDSAAGHYLMRFMRPHGGADNADLAVFGCDSIRKEGIYNKIGTYLMALAACENKVPVYFIADSLKIDRRNSIEIEMRPEEEIRGIIGITGSKSAKKELKGARILNPAFDCTPWKLISGVVTEKGIFSPNKMMAEIKEK